MGHEQVDALYVESVQQDVWWQAQLAAATFPLQWWGAPAESRMRIVSPAWHCVLGASVSACGERPLCPCGCGCASCS